jgi:uncharacterized membrane protein YdbT with pleckstrin-like domain
MEHQEINEQPDIIIRPATIFAFINILPLMLAATGFLFLAWWIYPALIWISLAIMLFVFYRFMFIRNIIYLITPEIIKIRRGIFFKRTDTIELYRVKDYILTQPFIMQVFKLMDLTLKTTDPENPVIWLRGIPLSNLVDTIRDYVQESRQHNRVYEIN